MKRPHQRQQGKSAFDLLEEATHLLRTAPATTLAVYFLGAIPFVLGLLFFWADMSRSPLAPAHLAGASLGMAALFGWMKLCQSIFARSVRAQAAGEKFPRSSPRRTVRIFFTQAIVQPWGLLLLPLAAIPALPFAWVFAFFQNVTVLDDGAETSVAELRKKSWKLAKLWPKQNHVALAAALGFAFCVFLNLATACLLLPQLCKMLFGMESVFTKDPFALLNTTFFAAMAGLTYLCVDPLVKTVYVLRCFYGESLQSGEDLKAELKPFVPVALKTAAAIFILLAIFSTTTTWAEVSGSLAPRGTSGERVGERGISENQKPPLPSPLLPPASGGEGENSRKVSAAPTAQKISPPDLDHAISQTIHEQKYLWRMPREKMVEPEADSGILAAFFKQIGVQLREWAHTIFDWLEKLLQKLFHHRSSHGGSSSSGYGWIMGLQILLYCLVAAAIATLVILLMRVWRNRRRASAAIASEPILPVPDLADENVRADQLPEDGWTKLAHELLARGEFRLALRAFYLASLSHLASRNLISIARFKSNRDYERELRRRAHAFPVLLATFGDNLSVFERSWYGMHAVDGELVQAFAASVERLKAGA